MGIDIHLFARKNKKCVDMDRFTTAQSYYYTDKYYDNLEDEEKKFLDDIKDKLYINKSASYEETKALIKANLNSLKVSDDDPEELSYYKYWNTVALNFINQYPKDTFFVVSDHEDPSSVEYMRQYEKHSKGEGYTTGLHEEDEYKYLEDNYKVLGVGIK